MRDHPDVQAARMQMQAAELALQQARARQVMADRQATIALHQMRAPLESESHIRNHVIARINGHDGVLFRLPAADLPEADKLLSFGSIAETLRQGAKGVWRAADVALILRMSVGRKHRPLAVDAIRSDLDAVRREVHRRLYAYGTPSADWKRLHDLVDRALEERGIAAYANLMLAILSAALFGVEDGDPIGTFTDEPEPGGTDGAP